MIVKITINEQFTTFYVKFTEKLSHREVLTLREKFDKYIADCVRKGFYADTDEEYLVNVLNQEYPDKYEILCVDDEIVVGGFIQ